MVVREGEGAGGTVGGGGSEVLIDGAMVGIECRSIYKGHEHICVSKIAHLAWRLQRTNNKSGRTIRSRRLNLLSMAISCTCYTSAISRLPIDVVE